LAARDDEKVKRGTSVEPTSRIGPARGPSPRPGPRRDALAAHARDVLAPLMRPHTYPAGELLWREGDTSGSMVSIDEGQVKIYRVLPTGSAVTVYLFGPGDTFGFMPFLDGRPYPASALALTEVRARVVSRPELVAAFGRDPHVAMALVELLATRLREAFDRIERSSTPEVLPRVASALLGLLPEAPPHGSMTIVELPVRSSDMASAIGVAKESFSRGVTRLVNSGVLHRLGPRRYQVLDPVALHRAAGVEPPGPERS